MSFRNLLASGITFAKDAAKRAIDSFKRIKSDLSDESLLNKKGKYPRYIHVSKQLVAVPEALVKFMGKYILSKDKGVPIRNGRNAIKAHVDSLGLNNKDRCRFRAVLKARHNQLIRSQEDAKPA